MEYQNQVCFPEDYYDFVKSYEVNKFPYNCIGVLYFKNKNNSLGVGTGFLIAPDLVLTVAHNVYHKIKKDPYTNIRFYPGVSGHLQEEYTVIDHRFMEQFKSCSQNDELRYDYALLKLNKKVILDSYFTLGLEYANKQYDKIGVYGYQGGKCNNHEANLCGIWKAKAHFRQNIGLRYKISTQPGNSGSPVMCNRAGQYLVIAIHKGSPEEKINEGRVITPQMLVNLVKWEKEMMISSINISLKVCENHKIYNYNSSPMNIQVQQFLAKAKITIKEIQSPIIQSISNPLIQQIPKQMVQPIILPSYFNNFSWDIKTPYANNFKIQGKRVSLINDGLSYQITSFQPLPKGQVTSVTFKIKNYGPNNYYIYFGIVTESRKDKQYSDGAQQQTVGYGTWPKRKIGQIYIDGNKAQGEIVDLFVNADGGVLMKVDTKKYEITFINNSRFNEPCTYQLTNPNWKSKDIYIYVTMKEKGQSLQMIG